MRRRKIPTTEQREIARRIDKLTFGSTKPAERIMRVILERSGRGPHRRALTLL
jgi:hypothetical protein